MKRVKRKRVLMRVKECFAWLPVKLDNNHIIWFTSYTKYIKSTDYIVFDGELELLFTVHMVTNKVKRDLEGIVPSET